MCEQLGNYFFRVTGGQQVPVVMLRMLVFSCRAEAFLWLTVHPTKRKWG